MKKLISSLIVIFALASHANYLEPLMGATVASDSIKIRVASGGCTSKNSFEVKKRTDAKKQAVQLFFIRIVPETCESTNLDAYLPNGIVLTYSFDELNILKGQNVYVGNPFGR